MRTKVKTPTLAQNARMGHPNFNTQKLDTRTSTAKNSTPKLQNPEFKITRKSASGYRMPRTARSTWPQPSPYPHGHAARNRLTHWAGWVHTIVLTPRPIPARESNYVPRLETVGGPGSQRGIPAASLPRRLRT